MVVTEAGLPGQLITATPTTAGRAILIAITQLPITQLLITRRVRLIVRSTAATILVETTAFKRLPRTPILARILAVLILVPTQVALTAGVEEVVTIP